MSEYPRIQNYNNFKCKLLTLHESRLKFIFYYLKYIYMELVGVLQLLAIILQLLAIIADIQLQLLSSIIAKFIDI